MYSTDSLIKFKASMLSQVYVIITMHTSLPKELTQLLVQREQEMQQQDNQQEKETKEVNK